MSDTIQFTIPRAATDLIARCRDRAGLLQALRVTMDNQNQLTIGHINKVRMTGTGPFAPALHKLGVRSGQLRRSVRASQAVVVGEGIASTIGSNVKYAGIHEFGGRIQRRGRQGRVNLIDGRFASDAAVLKAIKRKRNKPEVRRVLYGARAYTINMPKRAPIFHGIQDRAGKYSAALGRTAINFIRGGGK